MNKEEIRAGENKQKLPKEVTIFGIKLRWWISFIVTLFVSGLLANQLVQPLFSPRISDYNIAPMYIQSLRDDEKVDYYVVSMATYSIDVPLLRSNTKRNLRLISGHKDYDYYLQSNMDLICHLQEDSPYVLLDYKGVCKNSNYVDIKDINAKITAKIIPNGFEIKNVKSILYIREKLDYVSESNIARDDPTWWTTSIIHPSGIKRDLVSRGSRLLGLGILEDNNVTFKFTELVIKNEADLPIKGYKVKVDLNEKSYNEVCYDGMRLSTERIRDDEYLSVNLEKGQSKKFLVIDKADEYIIKYADITRFTFKGYSFCSDGWLKYKELFK